MFLSAEWVAALIELANVNAAWHSSVVGWDGAVGLGFEAGLGVGLRRDVFVRLSAGGGRWLDAEVGGHASLIDDALFTLRGLYSVWREVAGGVLDPVKALVQGKLIFWGRLPGGMNLCAWISALGGLVTRIDTQFVEEPRPSATVASGTAPEIRYAVSTGARIAYRVWGDGPVDLVLVPGLVCHLDYEWVEPSLARFLSDLSGFSRVITFDKRGMGLSDRGRRREGATLRERMEDLDAVVRAAGSGRVALLGWSESGPLCLLFAHAFPERVAGLILVNTAPRFTTAPDFPQGIPRSALQAYGEALTAGWGSDVGLQLHAPSLADDPGFRRWWAGYQRAAATPDAVAASLQLHLDVDARHVLPHLRVPTLILHHANDLVVSVACARYMDRWIPRASYRELPGPDHLFWLADQDRILTVIRQFLARTPEGLSLPANGRHSRRPRTGWQALTPAELEVVRLVIEGLTNREIGRRLLLSPRTVQTHLAHVFDKLDLRRRSELAAVASHRLR